MWYNPLVTWVLRSPLHGLLSANTLLLTYTGRRSGRSYTFPISYGREGDTLWLITRPDKPWWKNVRGGAGVTVLLGHQARRAQAEIVALEPAALAARMRFVYRGMPAALAERQAANALAVRLTLLPHS